MRLLLFCLSGLVWAGDSAQFRGPDRNGIFPEKNLKQSWPESGLEHQWLFTGLGAGYASVSVVDGVVYTTGSPDNQAFVYAIKNGEMLWKQRVGDEHPGGGYPGSRSTPTYDDGLLYVLTGKGLLVCLNAKDGAVVWQIDSAGEMQAKQTNDYFGMAENILIDGDKAIFTPGGPDALLVAVNKKTGKVIWKTEGTPYTASFCTPVIYENGSIRQIITMVDRAICGIDPETGKLIWDAEYPAQYHIHAVTPVFDGRKIYVSDGYSQGGTMFTLAEDGKSVKKTWTEKELDIHHGGAISLNGLIYGTANKGDLICLDFASGSIKSRIRKLGKGSTIYADGMLYCYGEKGKLSLVDPNPSNLKEVSSFRIREGGGQHWAHPVISNGILYIRHGDALMAFNIQK